MIRRKITATFISIFIFLFFSGFILPSIHAQGTSFTFGANGDINSNSNSDVTLRKAGSSSLDFFIALGDLSYATTSTETAWCDYVKARVGQHLPYELIVGNHEDDPPAGNNIDGFRTCLPHRATASYQGDYGKEYYFDYPATSPIARFILIAPNLNINGTSYKYLKGDAHYNWTAAAIDDARAKNIPWVIVGMHENCITVGVKSCEIKTDIFNLFVEKRVDLVLQGHDHDYQRSKQLAFTTGCTGIQTGTANTACVVNNTSNTTFTKGNGTILIIDGTGGAGLYDVSGSDGEAPYFITWSGNNSNPTWGFAKFTVSSTSINGQFVAATASSYTDTFSIVGSGVPTTTPGSGPCTNKKLGDADCKPDGTGKTVTLADFEIWRKEYLAQCSQANPTGCQTDDDGDGSAMDANFDYPGSGSTTTDTAVTLSDFETWRKNYITGV